MTKIEWTWRPGTKGESWNPIVGCSVVSPGCTNCYAMRMAGTRLKNHPTYRMLTQDSKAGPVWTGVVGIVEHKLEEPLHWRDPRTVFVNSMGDLFHEDVPDEWIDRVFAVMALAPAHTFQVLTKRPTRMREYLVDDETPGNLRTFLNDQGPGMGLRDAEIVAACNRVSNLWPVSNVWLGVSAEDQARWDERVEDLGATPAAVRFVSVEPMLGWIDCGNAFDDPPENSPYSPVDWVIVGGESGPGARPMHPDWARSIRDQCAAASVPFFFKQWGEWATTAGIGSDGPPKVKIKPAWLREDGFVREGTVPFSSDVAAGEQAKHRWIKCAKVGKSAAGRLLDGREHHDWPEP